MLLEDSSHVIIGDVYIVERIGWYFRLVDGRVAQRIRRRSTEPEVHGSSPYVISKKSGTIVRISPLLDWTNDRIDRSLVQSQYSTVHKYIALWRAICNAPCEDRTRDLSLTKRTHYHFVILLKDKETEVLPDWTNDRIDRSLVQSQYSTVHKYSPYVV